MSLHTNMYIFATGFIVILCPVHLNGLRKLSVYSEHLSAKSPSNHREPTQSVCVADCYFIVNVLDLPFASPIAIYR